MLQWLQYYCSHCRFFARHCPQRAQTPTNKRNCKRNWRKFPSGIFPKCVNSDAQAELEAELTEIPVRYFSKVRKPRRTSGTGSGTEPRFFAEVPKHRRTSGTVSGTEFRLRNCKRNSVPLTVPLVRRRLRTVAEEKCSFPVRGGRAQRARQHAAPRCASPKEIQGRSSRKTARWPTQRATPARKRNWVPLAVPPVRRSR